MHINHYFMIAERLNKTPINMKAMVEMPVRLDIFINKG